MKNLNNASVNQALNDLIKTNHDRYLGYQKAVDLTKNESLKFIFQKLALNSANNIKELSTLILKINGKPISTARIASKFHQTWIDFKSFFTGEDDYSLLADCEYGDDMALKTYNSVDDSETLITIKDAVKLLNHQRNIIKEGQDAILTLKDMAQNNTSL